MIKILLALLIAFSLQAKPVLLELFERKKVVVLGREFLKKKNGEAL